MGTETLTIVQIYRYMLHTNYNLWLFLALQNMHLLFVYVHKICGKPPIGQDDYKSFDNLSINRTKQIMNNQRGCDLHCDSNVYIFIQMLTFLLSSFIVRSSIHFSFLNYNPN